MDSLLIFTLCCIITSVSGQIGWWGGAVSQKRDCFWHAYGQYGHCDKVADARGGYAFRKRRVRVQTPARNGGSPCAGSDHEYAPCTSEEYTGTIFVRSVSTMIGDDSSSTPDIISLSSTTTMCTDGDDDIYDQFGHLLARGNSCERKRRRRRGILRTKRQAPYPLTIKNRDVLFMIDESSSVGSLNFQKFVRFAKAVVGSLCGAISVGMDTTRVGVLNFDRAQHVEIDFDRYFAKAQLLTGMSNNVRYHEGTSSSTCLVNALRYARTQMFTSSRGSRVGVRGTERMMILLTDGCANCGTDDNVKTDLNRIGEAFERQGISILTYLVTGIAGKCFNIMKGLSDGSHCYQQFHSPTWAKFDEVIQSVETSPCMDAWYIGNSCN